MVNRMLGAARVLLGLGAAALACAICCAAHAQSPSPEYAAGPITGVVKATDGMPIPHAYVGLITREYASAGDTSTGIDGAFSFDKGIASGYIVVQPPVIENEAGLGMYHFQPRLYEFDLAEIQPANNTPLHLDLRLPPCATIVLMGLDPAGQPLDIEAFEAKGRIGGQFLYAVDLADNAVPAVCWPVFDSKAAGTIKPRGKGWPALVVEPGCIYVPQPLFWEVPGYGKLMLRADCAGQGFRVETPGQDIVIELNVELARTAVNDLVRRGEAYSEEGRKRVADLQAAFQRACAEGDSVKRAGASDRMLADALRLRDDLELEAARAAIPAVRQGHAEFLVTDGTGQPISRCRIALTHVARDFQFGVFEGSPYNATAFRQAREAGFELATVLLGWNWCDARNGQVATAQLDQVFGIDALRKLGYAVKAHGVVWLQEYGILPDRAITMDAPTLHTAALAQQRALLDGFANDIQLWEAMNEPAATNALKFPREAVIALLKDAAGSIHARPPLRALVNSPHEIDYGAKFAYWGVNNAPREDYRLTYSDFLARAQGAGALDGIDIIGLQFYPGHRLNESFGGIQGPAVTPSWLIDAVARYRRFGKPIHITEFSVPSSYGPDWKAGYWREPWNEQTQADYAERVFTLAFATPDVHSITWWDVSDMKPSVVTGGLVATDGQPKPVFERLASLLASWKTPGTEMKTDEQGKASCTAYAGRYAIRIEQPGAEPFVGEVHIVPGENVFPLLTDPRTKRSAP